MTDIATRTRKVLIEISGIPDIADADHLTENLRLDSLDKIELVMALEEEFGIEIPDATAEAMQTVQHVITAMQRRVQHTQPDAAE